MDQIRKYRLDLEASSILNSNSQGIALFDLLGTFMIAIFFEKSVLNYLNISRKIYYASLIPIGVIVHILFNQQTFLNTKLLSNNLNIYQVLFLGCILFMIF
jgi:putative Ca2+/H+ antiporter (TMEM165/GDT1 family)